MKSERLFYPPNSLNGINHWAIKTLRLDGSYCTYTVHATKEAAIKQLDRMIGRYPSHQLQLIEVAASAS